MASIRKIIADHPTAHRAQLSRLVCEALDWRRPGNRLKDMSCRVAMLRMQKDGNIQLPLPRHANRNGKPYQRRTRQAEPELPFFGCADDMGDLHFQITSREDSHLWNEYIDRYHYLGYTPLPGAQIRYIVRVAGQIVALLGFGAAAWTTAPRDKWIGWTSLQRERHLHLVVNNARFLILPWVSCGNLASRILGMASRRLADDWHQRYGYRPVLAETFVEISRFQGTCYKAANWTCLGETQGLGKLGGRHKLQVPKKTIWIYPLVPNFRQHLCSS